MPNTMNAIRIENAVEISTTSGMPRAPVAASTRPFSRLMKPTTWVTALRRVIIKEAQEDHREGESEVLAADPPGSAGHRQDDENGERSQGEAGEHGETHTHYRLDLAVDAELPHDPVQRQGDDDALDEEGDECREVEVGSVLEPGLEGDGERKDHGLHGEDVQHAGDPVLVEEQEARDHHRTGQEMGEVEGQARHQSTRETKRRSVPRKLRTRAPPKNSGTRKTRILAIAFSKPARAAPSIAILAIQARIPKG